MKTDTIEIFEKDGILDIEKIINRYNSYIYKILKNSISNELDIEEILSDVFIIFWKNYKKLDINTQVKPYLIGITKNLIKKKYRKYNMDIEGIELYEDKIFDTIDIEELVENNEKSKIIQIYLSNINSIDKQAFIMFYFNQKKIKDIAKSLNISEGKVKISLFRTRKNIRRILKEGGYDYGK